MAQDEIKDPRESFAIDAQIERSQASTLREYEQAVALDWSVGEVITDVVSADVLNVITPAEIAEIERRVMRHFRAALLSDQAVERAVEAQWAARPGNGLVLTAQDSMYDAITAALDAVTEVM